MAHPWAEDDRGLRLALRVTPKTSLNVCEPSPNSGVLVLPIRIAPALRTRSTMMASCLGT